MTRSLLAALLVLVSLDAASCPLCLGAFQQSAAQQLVDLKHAVLAVPAKNGSSYRIVEVIKGERPRSGTIDGAAVHLKVAATGNKETLLLVRDETWPMWVSFGTIGAEHASWLRQLAAGKRWTEMNGDDWRSRVALMLPYLENPQPLVAEIAYREIATAPYAALLPVKSRLDASAIRRWLAYARLGDPGFVERESLYVLLLGIAGNAQDAAGIEQRLEGAWKTGDLTNLGAMLAADLQLRGAQRVAWIDAKYLRDPNRTTPEIEAALLALSAHGNANSATPRERVIQSYRAFMKEHKDIAGFVARDLAGWQYWDAVPEYVALMKSDLRQQYASRAAIFAYLRQSPGGSTLTLGVDLPQPASAARSANAISVPPQ